MNIIARAAIRHTRSITSAYRFSVASESTSATGAGSAEGAGTNATDTPAEKDPLVVKDEEIALLKEQVEQQVKQVGEMKDRYLRALADGENTRNRARKELEDSKLFSIQSFAKDLLQVSDVLEKALESVPQDQVSSSPALGNLYEGVSLTYNNLQQVFNRHQLTKIVPLNEKFDPVYHEAMFQVPDPSKEPGTVMDVIQSGGFGSMFQFSAQPTLAQLGVDHFNFNYGKMKWGSYQTPRNLALALFGEIGELFADVGGDLEKYGKDTLTSKQKLVFDRKKKPKANHEELVKPEGEPKTYKKILEELLDVFSYLICLASECKVDLGQPEAPYSESASFSDTSWDELEVSCFYMVSLDHQASLLRNLYRLAHSTSNICDVIQWKIVEKDLCNMKPTERENLDKAIKDIFSHIVAIATCYEVDLPFLLAQKNSETSEKYAKSVGHLSKETVFNERYSHLQSFHLGANSSKPYPIDRKPTPGSNVHQILCSMVVSAGLISEVFQWDEEVHRCTFSDAKHRHLAKELATFIDALLQLASTFSIAPSTAFATKMFKNMAKYPITTARNSAKKYTELGTQGPPSPDEEDPGTVVRSDNTPLPPTTTITEVTTLMTTFTDDRNWSQFHSPRCLVIAMFGEVGEVLEVFLKDDGPSSSGRDKDGIAHLGDEISDCMAYAVELATVTEVDLDAALHHYSPLP